MLWSCFQCFHRFCQCFDFMPSTRISISQCFDHFFPELRFFSVLWAFDVFDVFSVLWRILAVFRLIFPQCFDLVSQSFDLFLLVLWCFLLVLQSLSKWKILMTYLFLSSAGMKNQSTGKNRSNLLEKKDQTTFKKRSKDWAKYQSTSRKRSKLWKTKSK